MIVRRGLRSLPSVSLSSLLLFAACGFREPNSVRVDGPGIRIEFNQATHSRVIAKFDLKEVPIGPYSASESLTASGREITDFRLSGSRIEQTAGEKRYFITGDASGLRKQVVITVSDRFPQMALFEVSYTNTGNGDLKVDGWTNHRYAIDAQQGAGEPAFWSYQSGSYENRPDWVLPLKTGFRQENYLGMNGTDYGGGTPVADVWRRDAGLAVGHVELAPKQVSLPVEMPDAGHATIAVRFKTNRTLKPGETLKTFRTFVSVHDGDYFLTLVEYRRFMVGQGVRFPTPPADAFEPIWCAWGYGRDFTPKQVYDTLPVVKKLGFRWVTLDDGWQTAEGDWYVNRKKFPAGERDVRKMVDRIHAEGFKAQLWWAPMSVDPGTDLIKAHPEQLLLNADGSRQKISWWDAFYLCPAFPPVREDAAAFVVKALRDWGFDGLKIDGQYLNAAPPCHNPAHRHASPEEAVEGVPGFFKAIYSAAVGVKSDALVEICPCGTAYSFFTMPYMNMAVASDPGNSWQVRTKGKTLKALLGDSATYFGDHVEMSDGGDDFASTVGIGGVVGTNFTWPPNAGKDDKVWLTPEREKHWARWLEIYKTKMLSKGEYLGSLYDIGFDRPEAHAIRKDGVMYYAFFARDWKGKVELRGLERRPYRVTDYANDKDLGSVTGPVASVDVAFEKHLLLEAK
jgi:alpha-galactosidase